MANVSVPESQQKAAAKKQAAAREAALQVDGKPFILLLTPPQAAAAMQISERQLRYLAKSGEIPSVPIGRIVRYAVADVEAWIRKTAEKAMEKNGALSAEWRKHEERRKNSGDAGGLTLHSA